ncbi:MAG: dTDP-4-amino-4,6-dideoxygalactose transaminase [Gammaproteobacteria bacterium]|jgi:dTDP-4-amino-4,6-dideoxygalactose transaminase
MNIPMVDLKGQYETLKSEIEPAMLQALSETRFILGPNVKAFEQESSAYLGIKHAISCASGTDALHLALRAAGIKAGDEVITTAFTFIATAEAIRYLDATPVFVDIDPITLNLDPKAVEQAITDRTSAILPVHLFGMAADMKEIQDIASRHHLMVIEDCAQSFGSRYQGEMTGGIGLAGAFSFFPSKNLGCYGDGGMITTNDDRIAEQINLYRNHGSSKQYYHDVIGYNSRLDELQAVILRIKLKKITAYNQNRLRVAKTYNALLSDCNLQTPYIPDDRDHVFHQYTLLTDQRDQMKSSILAREIACAVYYPVPLHQQKAFAESKPVSLPVTESTASRCLSLPIFPEMNDQQIEQVCEAVKSAL